MTRKRLLDYLPPFMQDFAEIKAIMKTEQPERQRFVATNTHTHTNRETIPFTLLHKTLEISTRNINSLDAYRATEQKK